MWSPDAEDIDIARHAPRFHQAGSGPFTLTTRSLIHSDGAIAEYRCVHHFQTEQTRDDYRVVALSSGLAVVEETE